jgi:hypothetical protein
MEKEKLESMLIDFIDGKLQEVDRQRIEKELTTNEEAYKLYEQLKEVMSLMDRSSSYQPSSQLQSSFEKMLNAEMASTQEGKVVKLQPIFYRVAAAISLLIVGVALGFWINKYQLQQEAITKLQEDQKKTQLMMMAMMENQQSASQRILGVKAAYTAQQPDDEMVRTLIRLMDEDPNSNVRLAAIDALRKFNDDEVVRKALVSSLSKQTDPTVQISLIQLLVEMKEKDAVKSLQNIIDNEETLPAVKDEAHVGLFQLS